MKINQSAFWMLAGSLIGAVLFGSLSASAESYRSQRVIMTFKTDQMVPVDAGDRQYIYGRALVALVDASGRATELGSLKTFVRLEGLYTDSTTRLCDRTLNSNSVAKGVATTFRLNLFADHVYIDPKTDTVSVFSEKRPSVEGCSLKVSTPGYDSNRDESAIRLVASKGSTRGNEILENVKVKFGLGDPGESWNAVRVETYWDSAETFLIHRCLDSMNKQLAQIHADEPRLKSSLQIAAKGGGSIRSYHPGVANISLKDQRDVSCSLVVGQ